MKRQIILAGLIAAAAIPAHAFDWLTEIFSGGFDLNNSSLIFSPDGITNYTVSAEAITNLPVDLSQAGSGDIGVPVYFNLDSYETIDINAPGEFPFFDYAPFDKFWLNNSGNISFGWGDPVWSDASTSGYPDYRDRYYAVPRISFFYNHLNSQAGGDISYVTVANPQRWVITFEDVSSADITSQHCTVQCELFQEAGLGLDAGSIRMSWINTGSFTIHNTIVGLSAGQGYDSGTFIEENFSSYLNPSGDVDKDGILDTWEVSHFGHYTNCNPLADSDFDGYSNYKEYIAGTIPTDGNSYFRINSAQMTGTDVILNWSPQAGRLYSVKHADALDSAFTNVAAGIPSSQNSYTSSMSSAEGYYRVEVEME